MFALEVQLDMVKCVGAQNVVPCECSPRKEVVFFRKTIEFEGRVVLQRPPKFFPLLQGLASNTEQLPLYRKICYCAT